MIIHKADHHTSASFRHMQYYALILILNKQPIAGYKDQRRLSVICI